MKPVPSAKAAVPAAAVAATAAGAVVVDAAVTAAEVVAVAVEDAEAAVTVAEEEAAAIVNSQTQNFFQSRRACTPCAPVFVFVAPASRRPFKEDYSQSSARKFKR